jgi:hypothetical protein
MDRAKKQPRAARAPEQPAEARPNRDDVHEQRVPDQAAEGTSHRQRESERRQRPPNVDEAGGR